MNIFSRDGACLHPLPPARGSRTGWRQAPSLLRSSILFVKLLEYLHILLAAQVELREQIGTALARRVQRLFASPAGHHLVMTGEQNIGDAPTPELGRARILRIFQQIVAVRLLLRRS